MKFNEAPMLKRRLRAVSQWLQREPEIWPKTAGQWHSWDREGQPSLYDGPADPELEAMFWAGVARGAQVIAERMRQTSDVILHAYPDFRIEIPEPPRQGPRLVVDNTSRGKARG